MTADAGERSLAGKVALITGAGSDGIGRAMALGLAAAGADLIVHGFDDLAATEQTVREATQFGVRVVPLMADLSTPHEARLLVQRAIEAFGRLDILVANAAMTIRKPLLECTDIDLEKLLGLNLRGQFAAAQEIARHLVDRQSGGRIIMVSSINQQIVVPNQGLYCATKGGLMQLAKAMALEFAPHGITVNIIAPGMVETDFNRHLLTDSTHRHAAAARIPAGRLGAPSDFAAAAVFLAGSGASYVTGASIFVDGGLSLP